MSNNDCAVGILQGKCNITSCTATDDLHVETSPGVHAQVQGPILLCAKTGVHQLALTASTVHGGNVFLHDAVHNPLATYKVVACMARQVTQNVLREAGWCPQWVRSRDACDPVDEFSGSGICTFSSLCSPAEEARSQSRSLNIMRLSNAIHQSTHRDDCEDSWT